MEYCLLDVGKRRKVNPVLEKTDETTSILIDDSALLQNRFTYQRECYHSLLGPEVDVKSLIRDVSRVPEYQFRERTNLWDSSSILLGVFLRMPCKGEEFDHGCIIQRKRLIALLFTEIERRCFIDDELASNSTAPNEDGCVLTVTQFYDQLRLRHRALQTSSCEKVSLLDSIEHCALRPQLRSYQKQAIRWLIEREKTALTLPPQYVRLRSAAVTEVDFFADLYSYVVVDEKPQPIPISTGGILADEMGMGKTVEILALLLLNKRLEWKTDMVTQAQLDNATRTISTTYAINRRKNVELKCLCRKTGKANTITCQKCGRLQHRQCVLKHYQPNGGDHPKNPRFYFCPECWRTETLVESGATIIVSPAAIKHQWATEIQKHISCPNFRLFIYNGVSEQSGSWISPSDLASYDVVLTDYNVLKPEIYFTGENARSSRFEKRFLMPASPLTMIRWWRVCLDEAQMVEGLHNNMMRMVKALPAVHRWTVTGTPIEKTINNLYGLVYFLDYAPYNNFSVWREYVSHFQSGNADPLLTVMVRVMWRTCKASVFDQLGIPPQTEQMHYIDMSDLQRHFYRKEHALCAQAFHEKAQRIGRALSMAKMNIQTLNQLMEPLRKLRHDCTMPSVLHMVNSLPMKKLLTPGELHEHLVTSNMNDCKAQLRSVVSSLNGMAGVQILQRKYSQALLLYEASLRLADDYKTGTITVDSLLQIHALHNLLELVRSHEEQLDPEKVPTLAKRRDYEERVAQLEWRYIEQYASKVRAVETDLFPAIAKLQDIISQTDSGKTRLDGIWWRDIMHICERDAPRSAEILYRMLSELPMEQRLKFDSWRGLDLWLTTWWDKIAERHRTLKKGFRKLEFFIENLQQNQIYLPTTRARIDQLVTTAFACHLDPALAEADANGEERPAPAPTCLLCTVQDKLNQLEAILFLVKQTQGATGGLWQISYYEVMLKHILSFGKRQEGLDHQTIAEGDHCLAYLEAVKQEFKEYSRYWVELNYTVAAYDELNMCKSRLQLISEDQMWEPEWAKKNRIQMLLPHELDVQMRELQMTKDESERAFVRLLGTLKYLQHLGQKSEIDPCPICQTVPDTKYAVLQCGHHFCSICAINLLKIAQQRLNTTTCVICRHQQHVRDIQYVTLRPTICGRQHSVKGVYSAKIVAIVETVLDLKEQEPEVKIVIFSHWEPILVKLECALANNNITSPKKSRKYCNRVSEFMDPKQGVTCLLLPLRYGSKGLNLTEATHVFLVEPILNPGEELQALGRIHRIGQTRPTFVHRFIMKDTIEETIYETIQEDKSEKWQSKDVTVEQLEKLFLLKDEQDELNVL